MYKYFNSVKFLFVHLIIRKILQKFNFLYLFPEGMVLLKYLSKNVAIQIWN